MTVVTEDEPMATAAGDGRSRGHGLIPIGSPAPPFALADSPHSTLALDDLEGAPVVLVFHVADWHPVATTQLQQLEAFLPTFAAHGASVVAISADATWSHAAYAASLGLSIPLLADASPPGAVARSYGIDVDGSGRSERALVLIDANSIVRWAAVFPAAVNPGVDGVLSALEATVAGRELP